MIMLYQFLQGEGGPPGRPPSLAPSLPYSYAQPGPTWTNWINPFTSWVNMILFFFVFFLNLEYSYSMSSTAIHFFLISSPLQLQRRDVCARAYNIYLHKYKYAYIS